MGETLTPRLEACYFEDQTGRWGRMAAVLAQTAAAYCPAWRVNVEAISPITERKLAEDPKLRPGSRTLVANTQKLEHWANVVATAADGDRMLLIDADTFVTRPLDPVWDRPFDVAYTTKAKADYPFNAGVVFLRISPAVRAFVTAWAEENRRMYNHPKEHRPWRAKFAGMNQAALGRLLTERRPRDVEIVELPCAEWNCENATWSAFDPAITRIVHVKGALRMACLDKQPIPPKLAALAALWKAHDHAASRGLVRTA